MSGGAFIRLGRWIGGALPAAWHAVRRRSAFLGPLVQMPRPGTVTLVWRSGPRQPQEVRLRRDDDSWTDHRTLTPDPEGWFQHTIEGLPAGSLCHYEICRNKPGDESLPLASGQVRTGPAPGMPLRLLVFGDSGSSDERVRRELAGNMARWAPDLLVHTGDLVHPDGRLARYPGQLFEPYAPLLGRVPLFPCLGNHDWEDTQGHAFCRVFVLPQNGPPNVAPGRNYWFEFGDVLVVCIDSSQPPGSLENDVRPWLETVLAASRRRWKILCCHHPLYTSVVREQSGKLRQTILSVIDRHRVDLVLSGHTHVYERSRPLRHGRIAADGDGTVYLVTASAGAHLRRVNGPVEPTAAVCNDREYGFTVVDVSDRSLHLRQIGRGDVLLDECTIAKMGLDLGMGKG